ncbi:MAG: ABC transporter ATP-binding protein [Alphaproteobacteria bacterium]
MTTLLDVKGLRVRYGAVEAVRGIDISINEGEIVALLGANGAGKSSTLNAIVGLAPAFQGSVNFAGNDLVGQPTESLVRLGITLTPEGRRVFGSLTVEENLLLGSFPLADPKAQRGSNLQKMFSLFPILAERRTQIAGTLSGGQQQMLAIARSLMSSPRLLLLDEPSLGLAPQIVDTIFDQIVELRSAGITILLVEQNVAMSLEVADRGYLMASGSIVADGTSEQLNSSSIVEQAYLGHE